MPAKSIKFGGRKKFFQTFFSKLLNDLSKVHFKEEKKKYEKDFLLQSFSFSFFGETLLVCKLDGKFCKHEKNPNNLRGISIDLEYTIFCVMEKMVTKCEKV